MKLATVTTLAAMIALTVPMLAFGAGPVPDLKGSKWVGKTYSIVAGSGGHWPTSAGTFENPGLYQKDIVIEVTGQQDRRIWGMQTFTGDGQKTQEPFIGELTGSENREVVIADTDGYLRGEIDGDVFSFCYMHAGAVHNGMTSTVVSCTEVHRQH